VNDVAKVVEYVDGKQVWTWCPGCDSLHPFTIESNGRLNAGVTWSWNGRLDRPTFDPSLLCHNSSHLCEGEHEPIVCEHYDLCEQPNHVIGALVGGFQMWRNIDGIPKSCERVYGHGQPHTRQPAWGNCHSFLRDGRWQFLGDSAHSLAGQTVNMIPLPKLWAADANE
jgi:hypothetical protein